MASLAQMTNNEPALGFGSGVRFNDNSSVSKSGPKMFIFVLIALMRKFLVKAGGPYGAIAAVVTKMVGKKMFGSGMEADETGGQPPPLPRASLHGPNGREKRGGPDTRRVVEPFRIPVRCLHGVRRLLYHDAQLVGFGPTRAA